MNVGFFAPSYKRSGRSTTQQNWPFVKLVVMESEVDQYVKNGNDVVSCPDEIQGNLCRVRNWILDKYLEEYDCLVLMDDDINGIFEWVDQAHYRLKGDEWMEFCEMMGVLAKDAGVYFWGVNPGADKGSYREHTPYSFSAYCGGACAGFYERM
jgi:hypothetical protein